ncbi:MAG: hypothetical protein IT454_12190 [Planctomycetes bacterium]|nr:hypothetical protein [Planctomycetota bacterium]
MQIDSKQWKSAVAFAAVALCAAASAQAQSLVLTNTNVIATDNDPAPGTTSVFGGSSALDHGVIDDAGGVLFRGRLTGGSASTLNERGLFYGSTRASLQLVVRSGDVAPGLAPLTLNTLTAQGLGSSPRIARNGLMLWGSSLSTGVSTDDSALFVGTPGNFVLLAREGSPAAGTAGAVYSSGLNGLSHQPTGLNRNGRVLFQSSLSGGDVVASPSNNAAWYTGSTAGLEIVQRKGDVVLGGAIISALGFVSQMNDSGQVLHDETLSTTLGTSPATAANDKTLWIYTPGVGNTLLVREGDAAPGTIGATFNVSSNSWFVNVGANCFNSSGEALMVASMMGGDVVGTTNDTAIFKLAASGNTMVIRKGDPAPGLTNGETIALFHTTYNALNNAGVVAFKGTVAGPLVTTSNDEVVYAGTPGNLQLVAREGDAAVGTVGATVAAFLAQGSFHVNEIGQVSFQADLTGGDTVVGVNDGALFAWDPSTGIHLVAREGDSVEVQPGVFKSFFTYGNIQFNNGDANPLGWNRNGLMVLRLNFNDSTSALLTVQVPTTPNPQSYCTAGTTTNGCNALITANANPTVGHSAPCTVSVAGVEGQKTGLIFYGLTRHTGSWCSSGSSFLCVKSPTMRTPAQNTAGTAGACDGTITLDWNAFQLANIGALGQPFGAGDVVDLQAWFRDPPACKTTNTSNAVELTYLP